MDVRDAFRAVVRSYPGGVAAVAQRLCKREQTLRNELAGDGTAKLGVLDAEEITLMASEVGSPQALLGLQQLALNCGQLCVPLPAALNLASANCMQRISDAAQDFSAMVASVARSVADGTVTDNELRECDDKTAALVNSCNAVSQALRQINRQGKPASEVGGER